MHVTPINLKPLTAVGKFKSPKLKVNKDSKDLKCVLSKKQNTLSTYLHCQSRAKRKREKILKRERA